MYNPVWLYRIYTVRWSLRIFISVTINICICADLILFIICIECMVGSGICSRSTESGPRPRHRIAFTARRRTNYMSNFACILPINAVNRIRIDPKLSFINTNEYAYATFTNKRAEWILCVCFFFHY